MNILTPSSHNLVNVLKTVFFVNAIKGIDAVAISAWPSHKNDMDHSLPGLSASTKNIRQAKQN
jgi:hypothetical protein